MVPELAKKEMQDVPPVFAQPEGIELGHCAKRSRPTLGSTSSYVLEGLANVDPCCDVPLKHVLIAVRNLMAHYARPSVLGEDPYVNARSMVGPMAARENMI